MDALENLGRVDEGLLHQCAMFTTLSPCYMVSRRESELSKCSGACVLYKIPVIVVAENENFVGGEPLLKEKGVEVVYLRDESITKMMSDWIASPVGKQVWNEDIGEVSK